MALTPPESVRAHLNVHDATTIAALQNDKQIVVR